MSLDRFTHRKILLYLNISSLLLYSCVSKVCQQIVDELWEEWCRIHVPETIKYVDKLSFDRYRSSFIRETSKPWKILAVSRYNSLRLNAYDLIDEDDPLGLDMQINEFGFEQISPVFASLEPVGGDLVKKGFINGFVIDSAMYQIIERNRIGMFEVIMERFQGFHNYTPLSSAVHVKLYQEASKELFRVALEYGKLTYSYVNELRPDLLDVLLEFKSNPKFRGTNRDTPILPNNISNFYSQNYSYLPVLIKYKLAYRIEEVPLNEDWFKNIFLVWYNVGLNRMHSTDKKRFVALCISPICLIGCCYLGVNMTFLLGIGWLLYTIKFGISMYYQL